jgi:hypothetical protein
VTGREGSREGAGGLATGAGHDVEISLFGGGGARGLAAGSEGARTASASGVLTPPHSASRWLDVVSAWILLTDTHVHFGSASLRKSSVVASLALAGAFATTDCSRGGGGGGGGGRELGGKRGKAAALRDLLVLFLAESSDGTGNGESLEVRGISVSTLLISRRWPQWPALCGEGCVAGEPPPAATPSPRSQRTTVNQKAASSLILRSLGAGAGGGSHMHSSAGDPAHQLARTPLSHPAEVGEKVHSAFTPTEADIRNGWVEGSTQRLDGTWRKPVRMKSGHSDRRAGGRKS